MTADGAINVASRIFATARQIVERHRRHARCGADRLEIRAGDDQLRFDIVNNLFDLMRREPPVERRRNQAGLVEGEEQFQISRAVLVEDADTIAGLQREAAREAGRELRCQLVQFGEGLRFALEPHRFERRMALRPPTQHLRNRSHPRQSPREALRFNRELS